MSAELLSRVRALEARVAELEAHTGLTKHAAEPPAVDVLEVLRRAEAAIPVQARDEAAGAAAPQPGPPPNPQPNPQLNPQPRPQPAARSVAAPRFAEPFERFLGVTVLGRVGVAVLFLAAVYFAQLGWQALTPTIKVLGIYCLGGGFFGLGAWLRPRVAERYVALLWGAGVADLYLAAVVAKLVYGLVDAPLALLLAVAASVVGQVAAQRLRHQGVACLAVSLAAVAPLLTGAQSESPALLLVYLAIVHGWAAWLEARLGWSVARGVALAAVGGVAVAWFAQHWHRDARFALCLWAHAFQLTLAAPELLAAWRRRPVSDARRFAVAGAATATSLAFLVQSLSAGWLPAYPASAGVVWSLVAVAVAPRHAGLARDLARLGGVLLALGAVLLWPKVWTIDPRADGALRALALFAVTLVSLALHRRVGAGALGAGLAMILAALSAPQATMPSVAVPLALVGALMLCLVASTTLAQLLGLLAGFYVASVTPHAQAHDLPFATVFHGAAAAGFAWLLVAGGGAALRRWPRVLDAAAGLLTLALGSWALTTLLHAVTQPVPEWLPLLNWRGLACVAGFAAAAPLWRGRHRFAQAGLGAVALAAVYALGFAELRDALALAGPLWRAAAVSLYTAAFAIALLVAGFRWQLPALRLTALALLLLVTLKVGLHDLAFLSTPLRVLVTAGLGSLQLGAAWAFARQPRAAGPAGPANPANPAGDEGAAITAPR
jgi:uncharacterized membrane protein